MPIGSFNICRLGSRVKQNKVRDLIVAKSLELLAI